MSVNLDRVKGWQKFLQLPDVPVTRKGACVGSGQALLDVVSVLTAPAPAQPVKRGGGGNTQALSLQGMPRPF